MNAITELSSEELNTHIIERLTAAYNDVNRKDEIYIERRSKPKDIHFVDTMLFGCSKDRVIEEWIRVIREHSGVNLIYYGSSCGRFAIEVPIDQEDAIRDSIEVCLPAFCHYYETIEALKEFPTLYPEGSLDKPHAAVSWYTTDSNGYYRLVAANVTVERLKNALGKVFLGGILEDSFLENLTNYQRGCLSGWLQSVDLFLGYDCRMEMVPGAIDVPPSFVKDLLPAAYLEDLELENTLRYPHGELEIAQTVFLLEGDTLEYWQKHALDAYRPDRKDTFFDTPRFSWKQHNPGYSGGVAVDEEGYHTRVTVFWNRIDGKMVGFYEVAGPDNPEAVTAWLDETFPGIPRSNNFEDAIPFLTSSKPSKQPVYT